jgi:hypothetical protein
MRSDAGTFIRSAATAAIMLLVGGFLLRGEGYAAERRISAPPEYQVKAAFVYNFIKFVEWPLRGQIGNAAEDTVRLCVLGEPPDKAAFSALDGQEIKGKRLFLVFLQEPGESRDCHVLYLPSTVSNKLPEVLAVLQGQPTLTIGDTEGYARRGVMINMYLDNKRVRFEINAETAGAAGLRISAKLLNLAGVLYGVPRTGK